MVETLLDSKAMGSVMSSEFARKQGFKLKKIKKPIYMRNVDGIFNKKELIEHTVELNIYYQGHRKRTKIDVIRGQKQNVILGIPIICKSTCPEIHSHGDITSKSYKLAFYSSHLSCNTSYGGVAIIWVFHLLQQGYSYPTRSFMTELFLSVSQH